MDQPGCPRVAQSCAREDPGPLDWPQAAPLGGRGAPEGLCGAHFLEPAQARGTREAAVTRSKSPASAPGFFVCRQADAQDVGVCRRKRLGWLADARIMRVIS